MNAVIAIRRKGSSARRQMDAQERGFTLMETILSVVVIAIIGAAVMLPFVNSLRGSPNPVWVQQASDLVQGELEQVIATKRATGFAAVATGACSVPIPAEFSSCTRSVCYVPMGNLNDTSACGTVTAYKRVEVTVTHATVGSVAGVLLVANY